MPKNGKYVTRARAVLMFVDTGKPLTDLFGRQDDGECKVFTLLDQETGEEVKLDQFMLEFLFKEAQREL